MKLHHIGFLFASLLLICIALVVGYLLPRPLFKWIPASGQQSLSFAVSEDDTKGSVDVILLPVDTFNFDYTAELARDLEIRTGLRVKAMFPTPLSGIESFPSTTQFNALDILDNVDITVERLRKDYDADTVIVLTNRDINQPERNTKFVFSYTDVIQNISVVSSARLTLGETEATTNIERVKERVMKFALRSIGQQYFKLPRDTDPESVMFSPIMSLKDVDRIGTTLPIPE
ncbi:MAG: hypothetical protein ACSHX7_00485 [Luteolibacter sp.]